jgi:hypothetical protein
MLALMGGAVGVAIGALATVVYASTGGWAAQRPRSRSMTRRRTCCQWRSSSAVRRGVRATFPTFCDLCQEPHAGASRVLRRYRQRPKSCRSDSPMFKSHAQRSTGRAGCGAQRTRTPGRGEGPVWGAPSAERSRLAPASTTLAGAFTSAYRSCVRAGPSGRGPGVGLYSSNASRCVSYFSTISRAASRVRVRA